MTIYLLPGLGADERLFQNLDLDGFHATTLKWIDPLQNESIESYAKRLAVKIAGQELVLIGMSFGGIMSIELAKVVPVKKIILISSAVSFDELPRLYRLAGRTKFYKVMTGGLLKRSHQIFNWVMGARDPVRKELLAQILRDTDEKFLRWAVEKIVTWRNSTVPDNVVRIHGDNDRVLPFRRAEYRIKGGSHLMVADRAGEVSAAIKEILLAIDKVSAPVPFT